MEPDPAWKIPNFQAEVFGPIGSDVRTPMFVFACILTPAIVGFSSARAQLKLIDNLRQTHSSLRVT